MIIHLNGWPGVGKLTVARIVARRLSGRLVDNHVLHNVAASVCDRQTDAYWKVLYAVREIVYARIRELPASEVIVMTNAFVRRLDHDAEAWSALKSLADDRDDTLIEIVLDCSLEQNLARIDSEDRRNYRKATDPNLVIGWRNDLDLIADDTAHSIRIDNSDLTPEQAAEVVIDFAATVAPH